MKLFSSNFAIVVSQKKNDFIYLQDNNFWIFHWLIGDDQEFCEWASMKIIPNELNLVEMSFSRLERHYSFHRIIQSTICSSPWKMKTIRLHFVWFKAFFFYRHDDFHLVEPFLLKSKIFRAFIHGLIPMKISIAQTYFVSNQDAIRLLFWWQYSPAFAHVYQVWRRNISEANSSFIFSMYHLSSPKQQPIFHQMMQHDEQPATLNNQHVTPF